MERRVAVAEKARSESDEKLENLRSEIGEVEERLGVKEEELRKVRSVGTKNKKTERFQNYAKENNVENGSRQDSNHQKMTKRSTKRKKYIK